MPFIGPFSPLAAYLAISRTESQHYKYKEALNEEEQRIINSAIKTVLDEARKYVSVYKKIKKPNIIT